jgi:hypothetical protein
MEGAALTAGGLFPYIARSSREADGGLVFQAL